MIIKDGRITFLPEDMHFVQKFGFTEAVEMVEDFRSQNNIDFIFDTYQLADFFGVARSKLFRVTRNCDDMYLKMTIGKKNGKDRQIRIPFNMLKSMQKRILVRILRKLPVSEYATAYKKDAKIVDNAAPHVNKKYILKMDITDFFSNITFLQVYSKVFNTKRFPKQIGAMLTTLCCYREALPQGAPTSPTISNIVMKSFDDYIGGWCAERGISYTRYCDDMTFSSDKPLYGVYQKVKRILLTMGFEVNESKTHFVSSSGRQSVTGLTVNDKLAVNKQTKRELRQEVHYAIKYGLKDSLMHTKKKQFFIDDEPDAEKYRSHLIGRISYVLQIEPDNEWFKNALTQIKNM